MKSMAYIGVCNPQHKMQVGKICHVILRILSGQKSVRCIFIYGGCILNTDRMKNHETLGVILDKPVE